MNSIAPPRQPPRYLRTAIIVLALLALLAATLAYFAQPQRATRLILDQLGSALGLQINASDGAYELSPMPSLVVRNVIAREPGAARPLLRADRIALSLPWSTIRSRGSDLTITRFDADRPTIEMAALQHWLQQRPPGKARVPVLTDGLRIRNGALLGEGWTIGMLDVSLPSLAPSRPVQAHASGRYRSESLQVPFSLAVAMSVPGPDAAIGVAGDVSLQRADWRLPARVVLSGRMRGADSQLERMKLSASARYDAGATHVPFAIGLAGTLQLAQGLRLEPAAVAVRGSGLVPTLDASGTFALDGALDLTLAGALASWPVAWPPLPPPLGRSSTSMPFRLRYAGKADLSSIAELALHRDEAAFNGRFRLAEVTDWIGATNSSPLPPLDGRFDAPRLDIAGAQLHGVEITFDDPQLPDSPAPAGEAR